MFAAGRVSSSPVEVAVHRSGLNGASQKPKLRGKKALLGTVLPDRHLEAESQNGRSGLSSASGSHCCSPTRQSTKHMVTGDADIQYHTCMLAGSNPSCISKSVTLHWGRHTDYGVRSTAYRQFNGFSEVPRTEGATGIDRRRQFPLPAKVRRGKEGATRGSLPPCAFAKVQPRPGQPRAKPNQD